MNLKTNKVIGIYSGAIINKNNETKCNIGILLKYPLNQLNKSNEIKKRKIAKALKYIKKEKEIKKEENKQKELINQHNEIKINVKISKDDINKDIYFLDNTDCFIDDKGIKHYHDNLKELNELNTELYINDKKYKYKKYFNPDKEGIYIIKLKSNICINKFIFF